jgi:hypothetical protein
MRRFLPQLFVAFGMVLCVIAFVIWSRGPYQDPTPEMRALESRQSLHFVECSFVGSVFFLTGSLWILSDWLKRRFSDKGTR